MQSCSESVRCTLQNQRVKKKKYNKQNKQKSAHGHRIEILYRKKSSNIFWNLWDSQWNVSPLTMRRVRGGPDPVLVVRHVAAAAAVLKSDTPPFTSRHRRLVHTRLYIYIQFNVIVWHFVTGRRRRFPGTRWRLEDRVDSCVFDTPRVHLFGRVGDTPARPEWRDKARGQAGSESLAVKNRASSHDTVQWLGYT